MKIFKLVSVCFSLLFFLFSMTANAIDKAKICNAEDPVKDLLADFSSESVLDKLNQLYAYSEMHPMVEADSVRTALETERIKYETGLQKKAKLNSILRTLSERTAVDLAHTLTEYVGKLQNGRAEIQYKIADMESVDQERKNSLRVDWALDLKRGLIGEYSQKVMSSLQGESVSKKDKDFIVKWLFIVVPDDIQYEGGDTPEAAALHRHSWDLVYESGALVATAKVANGLYWLQTSLNHKHPGLALALALRKEGDLHGSLNVTLQFSPFLGSDVDQAEQATVCDFSKNLRTCELFSFKDWCAQ